MSTAASAWPFESAGACRAAEVIDTIEELLKRYPPPTHLRMDNGPEFIANALQEWSAGSGCYMTKNH